MTVEETINQSLAEVWSPAVEINKMLGILMDLLLHKRLVNLFSYNNKVNEFLLLYTSQ
jgi:hypothetical protein